MKLRTNHIVILVGLVVFLFVVAVVLREQSVQDGDGRGPASAASRHPSISLEVESFQTGPISNTEVSKFEIEVANRGQAPLEIREIQGSCPLCLGGTIDRNPIPPGRTAILNLSINPYEVYGFESSKSLSIVSNDPNRRIVVMPVNIEVDPELAMEPDRFAFGEIEQGETVERTMILRQVGEQAFEITRIEVQPQEVPFLEFEYGPIPADEWQAPDVPEHFITARLLPDAPSGEFGMMIRIFTDIERLDFGLPAVVTAEIL